MTSSVSERLLRRYRLLRGVAYVFRWIRGKLVAWPRRMKIELENLRYLRRVDPDGLPIPPPKLIYLVSGSRSISWFLQAGQRGASSIQEILRSHGADMGTMSSILDFGCGCGRVIRYWAKAAPDSKIHGTDYNPRLVDWCRKHLTFATFANNTSEPKLEYPSESFDLIYALSVFTHLKEDLQQAWMDELTRVLAPGGYLLISIRTSIDPRKLRDDERARFLDGQLVVRSPELSGTNMSNAFHPECYVREQLAGSLEVVDYVVEGARGNPPQDAFLLRKAGA